jgi:hypothetical protein
VPKRPRTRRDDQASAVSKILDIPLGETLPATRVRTPPLACEPRGGSSPLIRIGKTGATSAPRDGEGNPQLSFVAIDRTESSHAWISASLKRTARLLNRKPGSLPAERPRAVERDREVFAKALAKGGIDAKDPGTPEVDKLDVKIASERRRLEAANVEVATGEANVVAEVEHNRMTYLRQLDEQIAAADKAYGEAVEQLLAARTE